MNMKLNCVAVLSAGLALSLSAAEESPLKTQKDKISYAIGMDIGRNITNRQIEINPDLLAAGLKAVVSAGKPWLDEAGLREAMTAFQNEMQAKQAERMKQLQDKNKEVGEKNKQDGEAFLAENKKKSGVMTTPTGLQYKIITTGTGPKPTTNDTVIAHYRGTLIDGTEFDSSYKRGEPTEFAVTGVIKGWTEALQMMPVGSKWQLFIPSALAYGERGSGRNIGPGATLLFDIELVGIKDKEDKAGKTK
jgi:FKBP-type peptidyl-prolyl cis-trans isomerase FklB